MISRADDELPVRGERRPDGERDEPEHGLPEGPAVPSGTPHGVWASLLLPPGAHGRISEAEWFHFLEHCEPLHQWGGAFLLDEGPGGCVRVYLRDDRAGGSHLCARLDPARSALARAGVDRIEATSRQAADLITRLQGKPALTVEDMAAQEEASRRFVETAEALYRELLAP